MYAKNIKTKNNLKIFVFSVIMLLLTSLVFTSCDNDDFEGSTTFYGKVILSPSSTKNGEQITFKIGNFDVSNSVSIGTSVEINGKNVVKSVSYYVDGKKVAESSDKDNGYSVKYVVSNLFVGIHEVTAHCTSNFKHYTIEEKITATTLQVQE